MFTPFKKQFKNIPRHLKKISDFTKEEIQSIFLLASQMKSDPTYYENSMKNKTLLMLFEEKSLPNRISFETAMTQLGGNSVFYEISQQHENNKESIEVIGKTISKYVNCAVSRVDCRNKTKILTENSSIPIINGEDDLAHPCKILSDLFTIWEITQDISSFNLSYYGDIQNNITYDLMRASSMLGFNLTLVGPFNQGEENFHVETEIIEECIELSHFFLNDYFPVSTTEDPFEGSKYADFIYCNLPSNEIESKKEIFLPYQVNKSIVDQANSNCFVMDLPPCNHSQEENDKRKNIYLKQTENILPIHKALLYLIIN